MNPRKVVVIESPFAGDIDANTAYAIACCKVAINKGHAPFASHLFYTQMLNDKKSTERALGMTLGFAIGDRADEVWMCIRRPGEQWSSGMERGFSHHIKTNKKIFEVLIEGCGMYRSKSQIWPKKEGE